MSTRREDRLLAAFITSRESYDSVVDYLEPKEHFGDAHARLMEEVITFYTTDQAAQAVDIGYIKDRVEEKYPKTLQLIELILGRLDLSISSVNVLKDFREQVQQRLESELAHALTGKDPKYTQELLAKYQSFLDNVDLTHGKEETETHIGTGIEDLMEAYNPANKVPMYPESLNEYLGNGIIRGQVGCIFARPETGKSLFGMNLAGEHVMRGLKVLYVGNEDPRRAMQMRLYQKLVGQTKDWILRNSKEAQELAFERGWRNLIFAEAKPGTMTELRELSDKYSPDVVIIDQLMKFRTKGTMGQTEKLEYLTTEFRTLIKQHDITGVMIHQSGIETGHGQVKQKMYLDETDMYYSKTGILSQLDWCLGIGVTDESRITGHRGMSLIKNKCGGMLQKWQVQFDPELNNVIDF